MDLSSLKETQNLSKKISRIINIGDIIFLYGEIGVGKTTFVRFLVNHLEVENGIKKSDILSPTFNIVYDYDIGDIKILHYDLYRLKNYIKIVEWPELIETKPEDRIDIIFNYSKLMKSRKVKIVGFGKWKDYKFNEI